MSLTIKNKRARFEYELLDDFTAGIQLLGTEIKSIRNAQANIKESYCAFKEGELYIINMYIKEYEMGTHENHLPKRDRKLLLTKRELRKLNQKIKTSGLSIIPSELFFTSKGYAKLKIHLAKGKKLYDKRESLKAKDMERNKNRILNIR